MKALADDLNTMKVKVKVKVEVEVEVSRSGIRKRSTVQLNPHSEKVEI